MRGAPELAENFFGVAGDGVQHEHAAIGFHGYGLVGQVFIQEYDAVLAGRGHPVVGNDDNVRLHAGSAQPRQHRANVRVNEPDRLGQLGGIRPEAMAG